MFSGIKSRLLFVLLLVGCLLVPCSGISSQENPFLLKKVSLQEGTALEATEAKFSKAVIKAEDQDDSLNKAVSIAVLSDLHCKDSNFDSLQLAIKAINSLPDMCALALTGDLVKEIGSPQEYAFLLKALGHVKVPIWAVAGNHDFIYKDYYNRNKNVKNPKLRTSPKERQAKLNRFKQLLKQKAVRYTRKIGGHLLVFVPGDDLNAKCLVRLSETTLKFLKTTLKANPKIPTIIFCHAPLLGSYERKGGLEPLQATAQPSDKISAILHANPQVFLWVSGHIHMNPSSKNFSAKVNKVGKVTNIHTPPVLPGSSYVQLLKLSPEQAVVRTYNPKTKKFIKKHDRVFKHKIAKPAKPVKPVKPVKPATPATPAPTTVDKDDNAEETATDQTPSDSPDASVGNDTAEDDVDEDSYRDSDDDDDAVSQPGSGLEETTDEPDDSAVTDGASDASENAAAIERIRELVQELFESMLKVWNSFMSFLRP